MSFFDHLYVSTLETFLMPYFFNVILLLMLLKIPM